jgi:hypothetical protein
MKEPIAKRCRIREPLGADQLRQPVFLGLPTDKQAIGFFNVYREGAPGTRNRLRDIGEQFQN